MKKLEIVDFTTRLIDAIRAGRNGAEAELLAHFAVEVSQSLQEIVNAVMAKAVLTGRLPAFKARGRPRAQANPGEAIAQRYFDLMDRGVGYATAIETLTVEFHKEERQIMRLVKTHKASVGETTEARERRREWWRLYAEKFVGSDFSDLPRWMLQSEANLAEEIDAAVAAVEKKIAERLAAWECPPLS